MKFTLLSAVVVCILASSSSCHLLPGKEGRASEDSLYQAIARIAAEAGGNVGVAAMNLNTGQQVRYRDTARYPMHSVFKFPIAMAILDQVDEGKLQLNQPIYINKKWMVPDTWSPLRDSFPNGDVEIPLSELLALMVSQSDNIACDILIDLAGGEPAINDYVHGLGVRNINIAAGEAKMASSWDVQFTNWAHPMGIVALLDILNKGTALSKTSNDFLWKIMIETSTGPKRIKGLLPPDVVVAHKTGTSGTRDGVASATNDAGIIFMPGGHKLAIVVFVADSKADMAIREGAIAKITKLIYDYDLQHAKE